MKKAFCSLSDFLASPSASLWSFGDLTYLCLWCLSPGHCRIRCSTCERVSQPLTKESQGVLSRMAPIGSWMTLLIVASIVAGERPECKVKVSKLSNSGRHPVMLQEPRVHLLAEYFKQKLAKPDQQPTNAEQQRISEYKVNDAFFSQSAYSHCCQAALQKNLEHRHVAAVHAFTDTVQDYEYIGEPQYRAHCSVYYLCRIPSTHNRPVR